MGSFEDTDIVATRGRFGPYLIHAGKNYSIPKGMDPLGISLEQCIAIIGKAREESPANSVILSFEADDISVINGRYGPYIKHAGGNYKIPKVLLLPPDGDAPVGEANRDKLLSYNDILGRSQLYVVL